MPLDPAEAVRRAFDAGASTYDAARRRLVPCFDAFYAAALAALPAAPAAGTRLRVLDLGAGTGLFASFVAAAHPNASLVLIDVAPEMLAKAREHLAGRAAHLELVTGDLAREPLPGRFHAVVSGLAIHHLAPGEKRDLFARVHAALLPSGVFANADQLLGASPEDDRARHAAWERAARALGSDDAEIAAAKERMRLDRCDTAADQLGWMREAGFADARLVFEDAIFGVLVGTRSAR